MGIGASEADFLETARSEFGVDFSRTITLGRQSMGGGWAEPFLERLGATTVRSLDATTYENATDVHDLNEPLPDRLEESFSAVVDAGTLEHVFNLPEALRSAMRMVELGGHLVVMTPCNNAPGHGFYQVAPELVWRAFSPENGYVMRCCRLHEERRGWYDVADPALVGRRAEFRSARTTYLFALARRDTLVPVFKQWPQQSDYQAAWTGSQSSVSTAAGRLARLPAPVRRMVMRIRARSWPPSYRQRRDHFTRV